MVTQNSRVQSAKLANGDTVFVNDHVYASPPWSERDGTPYIVARIIEFLQPLTTPKKGRHANNNLDVRLSLYYRQSDISGRNVSDFRLLLAAIHTDVQPLSNVRGKCYVRHKDRIADLIKWKKLPDHFYFARFYDPYIKREYDVIRTENANNIPQHVRDVLLARYEFLLTEREMVSDLTDKFRACCKCNKWAASQDSVKCEACKKHYHMKCVSPPITAKPAKGYSWVCQPCEMQRRKDVENQKFTFGGNSAPPRPKTTNNKAKDKQPAADLQRPDVIFRGWPWRYFGLYTSAEDTLDADDLIFPRAATRIGKNFQTEVPTWEEQKAAEEHRMYGESEAGPSRHIGVERGHDQGERKHESTIDVWSYPSDDLVDYMGQCSRIPISPPAYDVERLNREVHLYTTLGRDPALSEVKKLKASDLRPIIFKPNEVAVFEQQLEENGGLDTHKTAHLLGRTPADVLRFSYIWKNDKLRAENEALRAHQRVSQSHARRNRTLGAPSLGRIRARADSSPSDDEVSLYNASFASNNKMQCAACSTKISDVWWRCPRTVQGIAMCESCGSNYRKYGVIQFVKSEDSKKTEKDRLKKKVEGGSGASTPAPTPPKLPPCACCRRMEPKSTMARCKICTFSAHAGCYGIPPQNMGSDWVCELCDPNQQESYALDPHCVLCPHDTSALTKIVRSKKPTVDFDVLSALKPTEGNRWAHILCSTMIPEVLFRDTKALKVVEGIATIQPYRWEEICSLCNQQDGATIYCVDCLAPFHPSCAWSCGYKFGFEFTLAKAGKREVINITRFKDEEGVMNVGCWCKSHNLEGRNIYDMHEMDPEQNETALQIFSAAYKALPPDDSFALLRKAMRLDQLLAAVSTTIDTMEKPKIVTIPKKCVKCDIDVSPRWHSVEDVKIIQVDGGQPVVKDVHVNGDMEVDGDQTHKEHQVNGYLDDHMDIDGPASDITAVKKVANRNENVRGLPKQGLLCHLCWFDVKA